MRTRFWRRLVATLALIVGLGVAAPVASAAATTTGSTSISSPSGGVSVSPDTARGKVAFDWWWGP